MRNPKESLRNLKAGVGSSGKTGGKSKARSSKLPTGRITASLEGGEGTSGMGSRKSSTGKVSAGSHK